MPFLQCPHKRVKMYLNSGAEKQCCVAFSKVHYLWDQEWLELVTIQTAAVTTVLKENSRQHRRFYIWCLMPRSCRNQLLEAAALPFAKRPEIPFLTQGIFNWDNQLRCQFSKGIQVCNVKNTLVPFCCWVRTSLLSVFYRRWNHRLKALLFMVTLLSRTYSNCVVLGALFER